jgi:hypothetical protein
MRPHDPSIAPDQLRPASSSFAERTGTAHTSPAQTSPAESAASPGGSRLTAVCVGMALAAFLWIFGSGLSSSDPHPGASSRTTTAKVWDNHQDLTRAAVAVIAPTASRRPHNSPTCIAVPCSAVLLPDVGYRLAEQRRPLALSPNRSQVRLRAPPVLA